MRGDDAQDSRRVVVHVVFDEEDHFVFGIATGIVVDGDDSSAAAGIQRVSVSVRIGAFRRRGTGIVCVSEAVARPYDVQRQ